MYFEFIPVKDRIFQNNLVLDLLRVDGKSLKKKDRYLLPIVTNFKKCFFFRIPQQPNFSSKIGFPSENVVLTRSKRILSMFIHSQISISQLPRSK